MDEDKGLIHLGMYYYGGKAYRARKSRFNEYFYVEELILEKDVKPHFQFARGMVKNITAKHLMPYEQAAMFSKTVGSCVNCLRDLTAPESLRRMYGPICATRNGWPYDTNAD